jgi:Fur family transcriptional regulator, ferric uptake regulator
MTRAPERSPAALHDIDDALRVLRASGHRVSAPARVVLEALFAADAPMSAEDIAGLTHPELDVSSVYRNLERLQLLGVVSHIHPGHGPGLYSIVRGRDVEYLACDRCHSLTPLEPEQLDAIREQLHASFGHHAAFSHFPIHGVCADCAAREGDAHVHGRPHHHHH